MSSRPLPTPRASAARAAGATAVAAGVSPRHAASNSGAPKGRHLHADLNARLAGSSARFVVLVVLVIGSAVAVLLLVPSAIWNVVGQSSMARTRATRATMATISAALNAHKANTGSFPAALPLLVTSGYLAPPLADSWNRAFAYSTTGPSGKPFSLISAGPDGVLGNNDDIDIWK